MQPVEISARDAQAAGGQRLVAVVLADRAHRQLDLVIAQLALERAGGLVVADVDYTSVVGGDFFVLHVEAQVFGANDCDRERE